MQTKRATGNQQKPEEVRKVRLVTLASSYSPIPLAHTHYVTPKYLHDKKHGRAEKERNAQQFFLLLLHLGQEEEDCLG
jgi:hypothetical protein